MQLQLHYEKCASSSLNLKRPLYLWNLMIRNSTNNRIFAETLNIYTWMLRSGVRGNSFTLPLVFKACAYLNFLTHGKIVHSHSLRTGFQADVFVQTSLIHMYSKCLDFTSSRQVFDHMPLTHTNVVSWNSIISAYSRDLLLNHAFFLLKQMSALGLDPTSSTFTTLVSATTCTLQQGISLHCCVFKLGLLNCDIPLANSIINMYLKFDQVDEARSVFDFMAEKSIISWTTIIGGYVNAGDVVEALHIFSRLRQSSIGLDSVLFVSLISGCAQVGNLLLASSVHSLVLKTGCDIEDPIDNLLVSMYAKCGDLVSARRVFDAVHDKSVFLWTSIISGYSQSGCPAEALDLFRMLLKTAIEPNEANVAAMLSACADLGSLIIGEEIEDYIFLNGLESDQKVQTSLIHMFCKCGSINKAKEVFDRVPNKDLAAWSSMINGYAIHGIGEEALSLFHRMQHLGLKLDAVVFTSVLLACSHSGLVEDGLKYFQSMQKNFDIEPSVEHYTCLVDLLGRAGCFELALNTVQELPIQLQAPAWAPLLSACRKHRNIELGEFAAKKLLELNPGSAGNYVLMANLYTSVGKWNEAAKMRNLAHHRRLVKEPGWSQVEINGSIRVFTAGDRSHHRSDETYKKLEELNVTLREAGYVCRNRYSGS